MKTLTELINCVLEKLCLKYDLPDTYCKIDNFISDDDKSAEFIRKILLDDSFQQLHLCSFLRPKYRKTWRQYSR